MQTLWFVCLIYLTNRFLYDYIFNKFFVTLKQSKIIMIFKVINDNQIIQFLIDRRKEYLIEPKIILYDNYKTFVTRATSHNYGVIYTG